MATKIPPHNLTEIVDATIALIKKPNTKDEELMKIVPARTPHGRLHLRARRNQAAYLTGRGIIQMRARAGMTVSVAGRPSATPSSLRRFRFR